MYVPEGVSDGSIPAMVSSTAEAEVAISSTQKHTHQRIRSSNETSSL